MRRSRLLLTICRPGNCEEGIGSSFDGGLGGGGGAYRPASGRQSAKGRCMAQVDARLGSPERMYIGAYFACSARYKHGVYHSYLLFTVE